MNYKKIIENLRLNVAELVDYAGSGHPGMGMSAAGIAIAVWSTMVKDKTRADWELRDRLVFSAPQGIVLQYLLHYYEGIVTKDELLKFRKKDSRFPGLSEYTSFPTVEATTGSLGQGIANSVGMAIGLKNIGNSISNVYCILGEGCLEEGISYESMSLAGALQLSNLVVLYDSNKTSIDGETYETFPDDMRERLKSINWEYEYIADGDDVNAILSALNRVRRKPLFIEVSSKIAKGSLLEGNFITHGRPLGKSVTSKISGYKDNQLLNIFPETCRFFKQYNLLMDEKVKARLKYEFQIPIVQSANLVEFEKIGNDELSIIEKSSIIMNRFAEKNNFLVGSADLATSTKVFLTESTKMSAKDYFGRNIVFGIRENAMCAVATGIYLATRKKTVISTYLCFSDLMKNSIRTAAIMGIPNIFVFTHDGISLAQDGATHIPIEQISSIRSIPNIRVLRPATDEEIYLCWLEALSHEDKPTVIILSRHSYELNVPNSSKVKLSGYVVNADKTINETTEYCILSSGSDVKRAMEVREICEDKGYDIDVISVTNLEVFLENTRDYFKDKHLIILEMSNDPSWYKLQSKSMQVFQLYNFINGGTVKEIEEEIGFSSDILAKKIVGVLS